MTGFAFADSYPSKPIRIIVPFGPGGASDITARAFGKYLQEKWKQSVVVDNRPGATGVIGTEAVKRSPPDGYTLGLVSNSTHAAAPHLYKKLPYDPISDFEHIGLFVTSGSVLLVPGTSPFKSIPQLVTYAKANPGKVFFGYPHTLSQISGELLKATAKIPVEAVAYKTTASAVTDLIGGQIQFMFLDYLPAAGQIAGGRLLPIAVSESKRNRLLKDIPTVAETYPGYEAIGFLGLCAPRGTPKEIVMKLNRAMRSAQADPAFRNPLEQTGVTLKANSAEEYLAFLRRETARWKDYVRMANIEPQ